MCLLHGVVRWHDDLVCYHLMKLVISFLIKYHVFRDLIQNITEIFHDHNSYENYWKLRYTIHDQVFLLEQRFEILQRYSSLFFGCLGKSEDNYIIISIIEISDKLLSISSFIIFHMTKTTQAVSWFVSLSESPLAILMYAVNQPRSADKMSLINRNFTLQNRFTK